MLATRQITMTNFSSDDPQAEMVHQACAYISAHLDAAPTLEDIGAHVHVSPYHLQRTFKRLMGISPRQYADALRLKRLKSHLRDGSTVTDAIYAAGYGSSRSLYERADAVLGMTPSTYGKKGEGMQIGFTVAKCRLGNLLVAATERGVCAVKLGDNPAALRAELEQEFSGAEIGSDVEVLAEWVDAILQFIEGDYPHLDLPLDIRATAFQARVWDQLRHIPYGETRTYSQVAEAIGEPKAVRAVARAIATNPVALVIPCHRVVHKDGKLSGYRWGVDRKRAILDMEHEDDTDEE